MEFLHLWVPIALPSDNCLHLVISCNFVDWVQLTFPIHVVVGAWPSDVNPGSTKVCHEVAPTYCMAKGNSPDSSPHSVPGLYYLHLIACPLQELCSPEAGDTRSNDSDRSICML